MTRTQAKKRTVTRAAEISRKTAETDVQVKLSLEGTGRGRISTGIGFLDHMLDHVARHGLLDVEISAKGDLHVDHHHTVEDVGLCLGEALRQALGNKHGIRRYGFAMVPMDEAMASVALDVSGRPLLVFSNPLGGRSAGGFALDLVPVFLQALADRGGHNFACNRSGRGEPASCGRSGVQSPGTSIASGCGNGSQSSGRPFH